MKGTGRNACGNVILAKQWCVVTLAKQCCTRQMHWGAHLRLAKAQVAHFDSEEAARHAGERGDGKQRAVSAPALCRCEDVRDQGVAHRVHERQTHPGEPRPRGGLVRSARMVSVSVGTAS